MSTEKNDNNELTKVREEVEGLVKKLLDLDPNVLTHRPMSGSNLFDKDGNIVASYVTFGDANVLRFVDGRQFSGAKAKFIMGEIKELTE